MNVRWIATVALVLVSGTAEAASSGWVRGRLRHYNNQANWCPNTRSCTGAQYTQAMSQAFLPVVGPVVTVEDTSGTIYGSGTTDSGGNYLISWWSPNDSQLARIVWE